MVCLFGEKLKQNKMFIKYNFKKNKSAFTLLEMIVSLSIIMLMSLLFIMNYQSGTRRTDLIMTAQGLVADIHFVQNNSLGLTPYGDNFPAGGWGVNFNKDTNSYTIFADLDAPGSPGYLKFNPSTEFNTNFNCREVSLGNGITIDDLEVFRNNKYNHVSQANITFLPPDPKTNILNADNNTSGTAIIIRLKDSQGSVKSVRVNFLGLVEVID